MQGLNVRMVSVLAAVHRFTVAVLLSSDADFASYCPKQSRAQEYEVNVLPGSRGSILAGTAQQATRTHASKLACTTPTP